MAGKWPTSLKSSVSQSLVTSCNILYPGVLENRLNRVPSVMLKFRWAKWQRWCILSYLLDAWIGICRSSEDQRSMRQVFGLKHLGNQQGSSFKRRDSTCFKPDQTNNQSIANVCNCQTFNMFQQLTHLCALFGDWGRHTLTVLTRNHWISSELHLWIDGFRCQCQLQRSALHVIKTPHSIGETRAQQGEGDHGNGSGRNSNQIGKANAQQRIPPAA